MFIGRVSVIESKNGSIAPRSPFAPTSIVWIQPRSHS
jgi:hypothetical protein